MSTQPQLSPLEQLGQTVQQQSSTPAQPTTPSQLSPLELLGQSVQKQQQPSQPGAEIQPVTTSTNPKLAVAAAGEHMPEYVGAVGAAGAGLMAGSVLNEATAPALRHIATEYGEPVLKAIEEAAKQHPLVAKLITHALADAGTLSLAKYIGLFGKK